MKTGVIFDKRFALHEMGPGHIESPLRIIAIEEVLSSSFKSGFTLIPPRPATEEELSMVHLPSYINFLKETADQGYFSFDSDTIAGPKTYEVACLAAGAGLVAADLILERQIENVLALVRPPGHHAESSRPMGFCFFNNIAITAEYLRQKKKIKRIMIVDWDLHHGNGTQKAFYSTREVFYISLHQSPLFPGTGSASEVGEKEGIGFNLNLPLRSGKTDNDYLYLFQNLIQPVAQIYQPEFILVSAGFDVLKGDPLGQMELTVEGCGDLTQILIDIARQSASGRLITFLEGGYNLKALQQGVKEVILRLSGQKYKELPHLPCPQPLKEEIKPIIKIFEKYWGISPRR
ncbi:MAG: histone deacetylase [Candidatus Saccharicenans sp.]